MLTSVISFDLITIFRSNRKNIFWAVLRNQQENVIGKMNPSLKTNSLQNRHHFFDSSRKINFWAVSRNRKENDIEKITLTLYKRCVLVVSIYYNIFQGSIYCIAKNMDESFKTYGLCRSVKYVFSPKKNNPTWRLQLNTNAFCGVLVTAAATQSVLSWHTNLGPYPLSGSNFDVQQTEHSYSSRNTGLVQGRVFWHFMWLIVSCVDLSN